MVRIYRTAYCQKGTYSWQDQQECEEPTRIILRRESEFEGFNCILRRRESRRCCAEQVYAPNSHIKNGDECIRNCRKVSVCPFHGLPPNAKISRNLQPGFLDSIFSLSSENRL